MNPPKWHQRVGPDAGPVPSAGSAVLPDSTQHPGLTSILPVSAEALPKEVLPRCCWADEQAEAESAGGSTRVMRHMFRRIIAGDYFPVPEVHPCLSLLVPACSPQQLPLVLHGPHSIGVPFDRRPSGCCIT